MANKEVVKFLYIGNVKKCTKYDYSNPTLQELIIGFINPKAESEIVKEKTTLAKLDDGHYVEYSSLNKLFASLRVRFHKRKDGYYSGGLVLGTSPFRKGVSFVDESSLKPYDKTVEEEIMSDKKDLISKLRK